MVALRHHAPVITCRVGPAVVASAKRMMRDEGKSMKDAACALGVLAADLDRSLWQHLGTPPEDLSVAPVVRHEPMF